MSLNEETQFYFSARYGLFLNFYNFISFVKEEIAPHLEMPLVIEDYLEQLYNEFVQHQYTAEQIHRGAGKTEIGIWITIFYAVCQPINPFSGKPIKEQVIITSTSDTLNVLGNRIKHYFYENPKLKEFIPEGAMKKEDRKNEQWNNSEMYLKNGSIIHLRTITSRSIRGLHVDRVWGDDLVGENSIMVDKDIEERWFYAVHGITTAKDALVDVTGTPRRLSDLMFKMKASPGYFFKARPILDHENKILSNKRWTIDKINQVKETIGSVAFQSEYMLNPIDDLTSIIKSEWIKSCFSEKFCLTNSLQKIEDFEKGKLTELDLRPKWANAIYLGMDFAFSDRILADKTAITITAEYKTENKTYYVLLDIISKKGWSGTKQLELLKKLNEYYKFDGVGLEENSIKAIVEKINELQMPIKRFWTGSHDEKEQSRDKYKPYKTISKRNLIERLGTMIENREIIIPFGDEYSKTTAMELYNELITFANENEKLVEIGVHSDLGISTAYSIEVSKKWNTGFVV